MGTTKGTATSSLSYTGIVTLSQYIGGKKITLNSMHNAGGKPLFDFLADCLAGDYVVAERDRPEKLLLLNITEADDESKSAIITRLADTEFIPRLTKPERVYNTSDGVVRLSFVIPQEIFSRSLYKFNAIGLYPQSAQLEDVSNYAALCKLKPEFFSNVAMSSVLVLDWELHISNAAFSNSEQ